MTTPNRMKDLWLWALKDPPPHPPHLQWVSVGKTAKPAPSAHRSIGHRTDQRVRNRGSCCRWIASMVGRSGADGGCKWVLRAMGTALELCPSVSLEGFGLGCHLPSIYIVFRSKIYPFGGNWGCGLKWGTLPRDLQFGVSRKKTLFRSVIVLRYISIFIGQYFRVLATASDPPTWPQAHRFGTKKNRTSFAIWGATVLPARKSYGIVVFSVIGNLYPIHKKILYIFMINRSGFRYCYSPPPARSAAILLWSCWNPIERALAGKAQVLCVAVHFYRNRFIFCNNLL